ncbi:ATP-binding protein [Hymenobacter sp. UYCo722]|uniref:sensor histidine kinase n=1 Tax=Hymenobacter sp. UYCo722 TaxID=3156335 RepID=UPI00339745B9
MKHFLLALLAALGLLSGAAAAAPLPADMAALRIDRLPAGGLMLNKGWRYHPGDDPAWARPGFDDLGWDTLNPVRPRRELPARLHTGMGWLRLRFRLGDSLSRQVLLLRPNANAAFEMYLDGQLLHRDGRLHPDPAQVQPNFNTLASLDLPGLGRAPHVLAVRFAPMQYPAWVLGADNFPPLFCRLFTEPQFRRQTAEVAQNATRLMVPASLFGLLTLLHLVFFRYNPARRANLYFAFYAGSAALSFWLSAYLAGGDTNFSSNAQALTAPVALAGLQFLSYMWAVRALYALFGYRPGRLYYGLWGAGGLTLAGGSLYLFTTGASIIAAVVFMGLAIIELLRLTVKAGRERQRGVGIIGTGFAVGLLSLLATVVLSAAKVYYFNNALLFIYILAPALGISLFLAREFALDAQQLLLKLREVEQLSAQTLAQEQDKQALLAAQNETLETQVHERTGELQRSLTDLRATQAQLIQREKMASLGELTAGIAHEIQNPLNFVNNFSEVSTELLEELEEEQAKLIRDAGLEAELVGDLRQNLGKISHHGRRAAAIVKGMLEHSRTSTGERAPTDLNQLCDEYLRLAYQGLRAKDKTFNATLNTDFAPGLPLVEAAGADVGRVLLNLFGNAFYAVQKRQQTGEVAYKPTVCVRTKQVGNQVEIRVHDNGMGIPDDIRAKIFQPFFTTKPTGEGTGLGLSLSYDIITKAHGGALAVESQPGQGTEFVITLPA